MIKYKLGEAFKEPVLHNALLVITKIQGALQVKGIVPLEVPETFTGTETQYAFKGQVYPVISVQQQPTVKDRAEADQPSYLAFFYDLESASDRPWLGIPGFTPNKESQHYLRWSMPDRDSVMRYYEGFVLDVLVKGPASVFPGGKPEDPTTPPHVENGSITWQASVPLLTMTQCSFFDFNWLHVFQTSLSADMLGRVKPVRLVVKSNPDAALRASVVQSGMMPLPGGGVQYDTVRIIMTDDNVELGDYMFEFEVYVVADSGSMLSSTVKLTLTIA